MIAVILVVAQLDASSSALVNHGSSVLFCSIAMSSSVLPCMRFEMLSSILSIRLEIVSTGKRDTLFSRSTPRMIYDTYPSSFAYVYLAPATTCCRM